MNRFLDALAILTLLGLVGCFIQLMFGVTFWDGVLIAGGFFLAWVGAHLIEHLP